MIPIVTPAEMAAIDAAAPEPVEVLIDRAGRALAQHALAMLGGTYGRRVAVIAGPGNNGNDGRVAAKLLHARGVRVLYCDAAHVPRALPHCDLVIDAAYGTGLRRPYTAPDASGAPVLAVDIPTGVDGLTGAHLGSPVVADVTLTFAALKPGLVLQPGRASCGEITVADIGLDVSVARAFLIEAADVTRYIASLPIDSHKWKRACWVIGGSPGMTGAPALAAAGAARAGAGYVRVSVPGLGDAPGAPLEAVAVPLGRQLLIDPVEIARVQSLVLGPGLGREPDVSGAARRLASSAPVALVVDGDGLAALGTEAPSLLRNRTHPTVLTPHDGEYKLLTGQAPGSDRFLAARDLAAATNAVVLLKGPTTVVAEPSGVAYASVAGDARLATAGTGDVLAGVIGGLLAQGVPPGLAAALGAFVHGRAATRGPRVGLVASDLPPLVASVLSELVAP